MKKGLIKKITDTGKMIALGMPLVVGGCATTQGKQLSNFATYNVVGSVAENIGGKIVEALTPEYHVIERVNNEGTVFFREDKSCYYKTDEGEFPVEYGKGYMVYIKDGKRMDVPLGTAMDVE